MERKTRGVFGKVATGSKHLIFIYVHLLKVKMLHIPHMIYIKCSCKRHSQCWVFYYGKSRGTLFSLLCLRLAIMWGEKKLWII